MSEKIKIIHCPTMVGGNAIGLAHAERALGFDSISISLSSTYFNYKIDKVIYRDGASFLENALRLWGAIFYTLKNSDIIHYNFGETLAPSIYISRKDKYSIWKVWMYNNLYARWFEFFDLRLARFLGKIITVTYQGDDARQGDYCEAHYPIHFCYDVGEDYYSKKSDIEKRRHIKIFEKYAHYIYAVNPDLLNVLPERAEFIPYASVDPQEWGVVAVSNEHLDIPHIVHAPSNRDVKGTKYILEAFERLQEEGVPFRYTLVEGLSNVDARKIYESADILVDQLLAGYYGGLAVELMALGKPVICYMRESDLHYMPDEMRQEIPVINADPSTIYNVLKSWLTDKKSEYKVTGMLGRAYVEKWHDPKKIAQKMYNDAVSIMREKK